MRLDGVDVLTSSATPNAPTGAVTIGRGAHTFAGDIYEVLAWSACLSSSDLATVETYLKDKWGTP